jgi:hypothetical protein
MNVYEAIIASAPAVLVLMISSRLKNSTPFFDAAGYAFGVARRNAASCLPKKRPACHARANREFNAAAQ